MLKKIKKNMTTLEDIKDPVTRELVKEQVKELVEARKYANINQHLVAKELRVNVSKIKRFEKFKCFDLTLYFNYIDFIATL